MTGDLHKKWPHRWLSLKAEAKLSLINGTGVFAREKISKGEKIGVLGGVIVPKAEIEEYWKVMGHVGIQINDDFFITPTTREELEEKGVFNHSCDPNIGFNDSITFIAIRDIVQGEELVFDYAFNETYHHGFECNCGSANCRKHITAEDWKLKVVQYKYKNYFSPYLKRKVK